MHDHAAQDLGGSNQPASRRLPHSGYCLCDLGDKGFAQPAYGISGMQQWIFNRHNDPHSKCPDDLSSGWSPVLLTQNTVLGHPPKTVGLVLAYSLQGSLPLHIARGVTQHACCNVYAPESERLHRQNKFIKHHQLVRPVLKSKLGQGWAPTRN